MKAPLVTAALVPCLLLLGAEAVAPSAEAGAGGRLPTQTDLWLAPESNISVDPPLGHALAELQAGQAEFALAVFQGATSDPLLGGYATLYAGRAELLLGRREGALKDARALVNS